MNRPIYIFDLDGTLSDPTHRLPLIKEEDPPKWDEFFLACDRDEPIDETIEIVNALMNFDCHVHIFTGRGNIARQRTQQWLNDKGVNYSKLYMRPKNDYTPDHELKQEYMIDLFHADSLEQCRKHISGIFEDRKKVVDMWRDKGFTCYQVAPGNF